MTPPTVRLWLLAVLAACWYGLAFSLIRMFA